MKTLMILTFPLVITLLITSCSAPVPEAGFSPGKAWPEVETAIRSCIGWAQDKDLELLYSVIANDSNYVEVHPGGRIVKGFQEFRKAEQIWMSDDFKAIRYEISDLKITFSRSGEVAWFICTLDDINEYKGQPASWEDTRWTGVLEKRDDRWTMVQMHFSFAAI
jgi:hypothetical protein